MAHVSWRPCVKQTDLYAIADCGLRLWKMLIEEEANE